MSKIVFITGASSGIGAACARKFAQAGYTLIIKRTQRGQIANAQKRSGTGIFSVTRFAGDKERADKVYQGIKPLTGEDIAEVVYFAASAPEHVQIAEVLVLATHQASGSLVYRKEK